MLSDPKYWVPFGFHLMLNFKATSILINCHELPCFPPGKLICFKAPSVEPEIFEDPRGCNWSVRDFCDMEDSIHTVYLYMEIFMLQCARRYVLQYGNCRYQLIQVYTRDFQIPGKPQQESFFSPSQGAAIDTYPILSSETNYKISSVYQEIVQILQSPTPAIWHLQPFPESPERGPEHVRIKPGGASMLIWLPALTLRAKVNLSSWNFQVLSVVKKSWKMQRWQRASSLIVASLWLDAELPKITLERQQTLGVFGLRTLQMALQLQHQRTISGDLHEHAVHDLGTPAQSVPPELSQPQDTCFQVYQAKM